MPRITALSAFVFALSLSTGGTAFAADAGQVFKFYCAQCHGLEGKGDGPNVTEDFATDPRNFTNADEMSKLTDADIRNVVMDGGPSVSKSELMPPWGKTLTKEEVDALVEYLRKLCNCMGSEG